MFRCPEDTGADNLFDEYGTSYEWNILISGKKIDSSKLIIAGFELNPPILGDAEQFHGNLGRNYLFPDGRVVKSVEVLLDE